MKRYKYILSNRLRKQHVDSKRFSFFLRKLKILSFLKNDKKLNNSVRQHTIFNLTHIVNLSSYQNNFLPFCILTGRTRFILTDFNLSRISFKEFIYFGYAVGFYCSS